MLASTTLIFALGACLSFIPTTLAVGKVQIPNLVVPLQYAPEKDGITTMFLESYNFYRQVWKTYYFCSVMTRRTEIMLGVMTVFPPFPKAQQFLLLWCEKNLHEYTQVTTTAVMAGVCCYRCRARFCLIRNLSCRGFHHRLDVNNGMHIITWNYMNFTSTRFAFAQKVMGLDVCFLPFSCLTRAN